ncbi:hypothetical protein Scep_026912 [Stephania cephalantha]|uniref:EF-hand domain-containing protein n=1 Tax=Stephania cephalantha TaxID=152367 RepID=A0AAP0HNL1_9MAGN
MPNNTHSDSENEKIDGESSSEEEVERGREEEEEVEEEGVPEYEKQRLERIRENKARFEALRLRSLASAFAKTVKEQGSREEKEKKGSDDEYRPSDGEERVTTSSDDDDDDGEDEEEEWVGTKSSRGSAKKGKKGSSMSTKKSTKKASVPTKNMSEVQCIDEDEALRQAIALSLEDMGRPSGELCSSSGKNMKKDPLSGIKKGSSSAQENDTRKIRRKRDAKRVQMTEEQVITHFFNLDGSGRGGIRVKDLRRAAAAHDFTWTDNEINDMIHCFDSDGDGKLNLEDFRSIICRLRMLQNPQNV